jgi:CheY-like chemotaxis protein
MNILICEDHKLIAMDLEDMLSAQGHTVEGIVDSAIRCLERCAENPPDLVVTDLNLADGRTGLGLVDALAEQGIPTVIVSGDAGSVPTSTPAKAVIEKPVHECELAIVIGRME